MKFVVLVLWTAAVGCAQPCIRHSDCPNQLVCQLGACIMPAVDGDVPDALDVRDVLDVQDILMDGATDGGVRDAGSDALDANTDATSDASTDASLDASTDAPTDANASDGFGMVSDAEWVADIAVLDVPLMNAEMLDALRDAGSDADSGEEADSGADAGDDMGDDT